MFCFCSVFCWQKLLWKSCLIFFAVSIIGDTAKALIQTRSLLWGRGFLRKGLKKNLESVSALIPRVGGHWVSAHTSVVFFSQCFEPISLALESPKTNFVFTPNSCPRMPKPVALGMHWFNNVLALALPVFIDLEISYHKIDSVKNLNKMGVNS